MNNNEHIAHPSVKLYLLVFVGLAILTGLTVLLSYAGLKHSTAVGLAILIASVKCFLIGTFFMHLKTEKIWIVLIIITALILVGFLLAPTMQDIGFHH